MQKSEMQSVLDKQTSTNRQEHEPETRRFPANIRQRRSSKTLLRCYQSFFYTPTDAQLNFLKNHIKVYIKTVPTCFGAVTPSSGSSLFVLAKVTFVKIVN